MGGLLSTQEARVALGYHLLQLLRFFGAKQPLACEAQTYFRSSQAMTGNTSALRSLSNLPRASVIRWLHAARLPFLNRTNLESSPQSRYMFDNRKILLINALKYIHGETRTNCYELRSISPNSVELITGDFHNPLTSRSQTLDGPTVSCLELII